MYLKIETRRLTSFTVSAVDADEGSNAEFTFRIGGVFFADDNGMRIGGSIVNDYFTINATTGEFCVLRRLDREGDHSFGINLITVEAGISDNFGFQFAHVRVCDLNDNPPDIQPTALCHQCQ